VSKFRKILCLGFAILVCCSTAQPVNAATRLGPEHLYMWAKRGDLTRLHQYQRYINLQDKNHNTALCIAQQHQDKNAYALLLKFGASTKVSCHDDDDPICAVVAGEKTKISPAAWWLLGTGAAAGAYALLNNDGGHKHKKCPVGYEKDLNDCSKETHPEGWNYYRSGEADGHVCGKCEPKTCAIGYSTDYPSVDRCGTTGANGWRWKQDPVTPYAGNDICGNCTPKQCTEYAGGDGAEDIAHCRTFPTLDVAIDTNVVGYAGDTACYKCTYTCKDEYYSSEQACKEGGYKCVSTTENNVTCWRQTGPAGCPDPSYTQGLVNCNAKAHPEGYTYTSSGQSGGEICGKCIPKTCVNPYTTSAQSVDGCGTTGANGYSWTQDSGTPYAGDLKCSQCTPYQCSRYDSGKGVANVDQCTVYEHLVAAIDTNVIGYAGETPCYKCTYTCRDDYYATEASCKDGGYTCSSATENNITCWWHTGSEECPSTYPEKGSCPAVKTGYTLVSSSSTKVGENTCYKCNYACDTANGWEQRTSCWVGKTCISQDLPYGVGTCYKPTGCSTDYPYTTKAACEEGGYICTESYAGSGCWKRGDPSACPDPTYTPGLVNCNAKSHPEGYTYTSSGQSGGQVCGKCTPKTCVSPYTTSAQSVDQCGTKGANGYAWSQDTMTPYAGDLKCSQCTPYQCSRYDSGKGVANVDQCTTYSTLDVAIDTNVIGYAGETPCYKCTYTCKDEYYTKESECKEGGYTCTSSTENNITCWRHTGSEECPSTYPEKNSCPASETGYTLTSSSSIVVGGNLCYKCNYACDTANGWEKRTSCWVGKTCQTKALPYGEGTCYKPTGCSTDYPYTTKAACEQGGYTCTESYAGSGCWKRDGASSCPDPTYTPGLENCNGKAHPEGYTYTSSGSSGGQVCGKCNPKTCTGGYTTSAQSVDQCGTKGANGYTWSQDTSTPYAGDLKCSKCTPYQCSRYDSGKGVSEVSQCDTYSTLDVAIDTNVIGYAGETPCYRCTYTCKDEYYSKESECTAGGYTCTSSTQNNVQCWWHTGSGECPTEYPEKNSCPAVKTGYTLTSSSSTTVGDNTCYKCNYACDTANGWELRTACWAGKTCATQNLPYGGTCYKPTGCSTDYPYTSKEACETGGYTCTESYSGSGCWKRGDPSACPDPTFTPGLANCNAKAHPEGYTYTSSGSSGGQVCGKCNPKTCTGGYTTSAQSVDQCGTKGANGYTWSQDTSTPYAGDLKCSKCTPYQCNHYDSGKGVANVDQCITYSTLDVAIDTNVIGYAGETPCYKCTYTCKDEYYSEKSKCTEGGYTCTSATENNLTCWWHTGSENCPSTYPEKNSCPAAKTGYTLTSSSSTTVGDNTCYKCNYACDTANGWEQRTSCWVGKTCQTQTLPYGGTCYKATGCSTDYPYTSKASCETGGYTCTESYSGSGCWKRSGSAECPTDYPEKSSCPAAQTGYTLTSSSSTTVGDNTCYKCNYACDTANGWEQRTSCWVGKTCQTKALPYGAGTCYKPTGCSTDYPYTSKASCETGGYTCTESYSGSGCWKRSGSGECPSTYPEKGSCPAAQTGYTLTSSSSTTVGDNTCYKCNYACDTANGWELRTSCWTGKTCQTKALPYSAGTCYKATGCSTDYPYTSKAACETGGYTCTESYSGSGCWARTGTQSCSALSPDYIDTNNVSDCKTYSVIVATDTNIAAWIGTKPCYICSYTCKDDYYDEEEYCLEDDNPKCSSVTEHGVECWYPSKGGASLNSNMTMINTTERNITSSGNEDVYGLKGTSNLENAVDDVTGEAGAINITHNSTGKAVGLYGEGNGTVANRSGASINIANNTDGTAVGMHTSLGGTAINEGTITITGNLNTGTAIGIYGEGANRIINAENAIINVTSGNAYGIYLKDGNNSEITNAGTIYANGDNAHGIYVDENAHNATIINTGSIYLNGTNAGDAGITLNGGTLRNMSLMSFNGAANLNDLNGLIYLEDGGVYQAESLEGDLNVGTSNVLGGNQDTYVNEGALQADNIDNLNLASESAMFTARATTNANGNGNDVVLERKDFAEFTPNESIANYLEDNYRAGNMEEMYDEIKSQRSQPNVNLAIAKDLGYDIFPNFADENYLTLKSLNRNITDTVLTPTDEVNRVVAGTDYINLETDNKGFLSGYDLDATSMYTFGDKRLDNQNRLGLGLSITRLTSDYDRGGDRKLTIFNLFVPYMHKFTDNLRLASILSAGYGNGEYDRENNHESDITDIFYGWTNELRYTMDLNGFAELEPALMLNALGYTEDGFDEGHGAGAIESKKTHNMSVEGGVGLFLKKKVSLEKYGRLGFKIGGAYYREMADPYDDIEARNRGAHGWYKINDYANIYDRDRALLEAAVDYEYKNIGLYAKYNQLIQRNDPKLIDLGLKVNF